MARLATWRFGLWRIYGRFTDDLWTIYGGSIEEIGGFMEVTPCHAMLNCFFLSAKWKACVTACNGAPKRPLHQTIEPSRRMHSHVPQLTSWVKNSKQQNKKKTWEKNLWELIAKWVQEFILGLQRYRYRSRFHLSWTTWDDSPMTCGSKLGISHWHDRQR